MRVFLKSLLSQPILHFLILGGLLFVLYGWVTQDSVENDSKRIVIDKNAILEFVQYRNRAFNSEAAEAYLAQLGDEKYDRLVKQLIRDQVLFLEAKKMGLDNDDYVIKRRLIQKMEYLARGFGLAKGKLGEDELANYFESQKMRYFKPSSITFTHVFIDKSKPSLVERATKLLEKLNRENISFSDALGFGDRFLYHSNYVERDLEYVASHFGDDFAQKLSDIAPDSGLWTGPVSSKYGLHLVMVAKKQAGGVPQLPTIRNRVYQDAVEAKLKKQSETSIQEIIDSYDIVKKDLAVKSLPANKDVTLSWKGVQPSG